ncbi:MAG TPA: FTR1 family protein [Hyphomicrobiaceae bacterium]|nr:FTR1 family protein [Hyphomicrobiaceae bacterium]
MDTSFIEALTVVLREGLEAILVLAALAAYLASAGAGHRLKALWSGAALALLVSIGAAWVFERYYNGAHNDIVEGVIIFIAAALMLYVSGWLFLKQDPAAWKAHLDRHAERALSAGSAYLIGALSFLAVSREGAETILFLHVLAKSSGGWTAPLVSGGAAAVLALAALFWIIVKTTRRLPLRGVFLATSFFLFVMGVKFVGEGLQELQEQAVIPFDIAPGADLLMALGLNPTWEAIAAQAAVIILAALSLTVAARTSR